MLYGVGSTTLGFHGVTATFGDVSLRNSLGSGVLMSRLMLQSLGWMPKCMVLGGLDWYFEGNVFQYYDDALSEGGEHETGYTGYVSASAYPGILVVLLEGRSPKTQNESTCILQSTTGKWRPRHP